MNNKFNTFEEMGIVFTNGSGCVTCDDNSCHNIVPNKKNQEEYHVHISTNIERTIFKIFASTVSNSCTLDEISEEFIIEKDAVKFICDNFVWFKCF
jgi:hypothetical protein